MKLHIIIMTLLLTAPLKASADKDESIWNNQLKQHFFAGKSIEEGENIIRLDAPYRAEDPALVPIKVISQIPQTSSRYIKKILLLVDKNPYPFVGEFELTPESGKADLAMRIRVNTYSYVRAIAEMNDGKLYMTKTFVKASGGCSAPIGADLDAAMRRLGKMKFRVEDAPAPGEPTLAQLMISHPNITGMQMDQVTRFIRRSHFMDQLTVKFDGKTVLKAKTDIAISADPNFRFYFVPNHKGELVAEFTDTSCEKPTSRAVCESGSRYSKSYTVDP